MNRTWTFGPGGNGWEFRLSRPHGKYLACGKREILVATLPAQPVLLGPSYDVGRHAWGSGGLNERWYDLGWIEEDRPSVLYYARGIFRGEVIAQPLQLWWVDVATGNPLQPETWTKAQFGEVQDAQCAVARGGHYGTAIAGQGLWVDGIRLPEYWGWNFDLDGRDAISAWYGKFKSDGTPDPRAAVYAGPQMYRDGVHVGGNPSITEENGALVREGVFTSRLQSGRVKMWTPDDLTLLDITTVPANAGYTHPVPCRRGAELWMWQQLEHVAPGDRTMLQGYVVGSPSVYASERKTPDGAVAHSQGLTDVVYDAASDTFVVATLHDGAQIVVEWVPATVERKDWADQSFPPEIENPPAPVPPQNGESIYLIDLRAPYPGGHGGRYDPPTGPDRVMADIAECESALFNRDSYHYGPPNRDWRNAGGVTRPWLNGSGSSSLVTGEEATTAGDKDGMRVIVSWHAIAGLAQNALWEPQPDGTRGCAAIWCGGEGSSHPALDVKRQRRMARQVMAEWELTDRPIIIYSDTDVALQAFLDLIEPDGWTWFGLRFYYVPGQGRDFLRAMADEYRRVIPSGTPVAFHAKCYSQRGRVIPVDTLIDSLFATADIAREWEKHDPGTVRAFLGFSDGRGNVAEDFGGLRWYGTRGYQAWNAVARACRRPPIFSRPLTP